MLSFMAICLHMQSGYLILDLYKSWDSSLEDFLAVLLYFDVCVNAIAHWHMSAFEFMNERHHSMEMIPQICSQFLLLLHNGVTFGISPVYSTQLKAYCNIKFILIIWSPRNANKCTRTPTLDSIQLQEPMQLVICHLCYVQEKYYQFKYTIKYLPYLRTSYTCMDVH